ncbi:NAD(P)H-hydrate epimerase [Ekhidna lutea]|uniref:Bifunctional NAD(P)H-hydrate repair enzyme n=1 Tax=Ekhidna lutea TaxID=447679 RepID=A0A239J7Z0_EKHLU|nr:NAD(P)H-hydrate dehydratase [Ekhidna lutea]SNT01618.1 NAD(P)H-hydrate epimerase [Ekhidna lutea]
MKVLTSEQIRAADQYTIKHEPISSLDLMERASEKFVLKFMQINRENRPVRIFCGVGNNGGDGLAIGRLLKDKGWDVYLYIVGNTRKGSEDFKANLERSGLYAVLNKEIDLPKINDSDIVIDGLFGSGLSRPLDGFYREVVEFLNGHQCTKVSIDIASGLYANQAMPGDAVAFKPDFTLSFQVPKLAFFLPDCHPYVGEWCLLDIGLNQSFIQKQESNIFQSELKDISPLFPVREKFIHKNKAGRLMIAAGSKGKMGAAILCARAAFKSGVGLVNICSPKCGVDILQVTIPEAMVVDGKGANEIHSFPKTEDTILIGPGLGTKPKTIDAFEKLLKTTDKPMVIDADGLNILSKKKSLLKLVPKESILTPHPGEFKRLVGEWKNDFDRLYKLQNFCVKHEFNVVLKGAYSAVCNSTGDVHFNPTGNSGLATAGSGDVLAGIIGALLSQSLKPFDALRLGVYLHGAAGDEAGRSLESPWIQASDIVNFLPKGISSLLNRAI